MTVSSQTSTATFVGNGVATAFPLPFRFFDNGDIRAYFIDSVTGAATQMLLGTDYTLIGAGEPEVDGNALSLLTTTVPLASMRGLYVERVMPHVQETDIVNQGQFFASTHEDVFDRLTMLIQQANANSSGAIRVAIGDPEPQRLIPASQRANLLLGFDSQGQPIAVSPASGSSADLALMLANDTDPLKGAGMVGYSSETVFSALERLGAASFVMASESSVPDTPLLSQAPTLQAAWDAAAAEGKPFVIDGVYWVATTPKTYGDGLIRNVGLQVPNNSVCVFTPGSAIKVIPNNQPLAYIINFYLADNFQLINPVVYGDVDEHLGVADESFHCYNIVNCTNGYIHRPKAFNAWGDGLYIGTEYSGLTNKQLRNVTVFEPYVRHCGRNCISVTSGIEVNIVRPDVGDAFRTDPRAGIDVEPEGVGACLPELRGVSITGPIRVGDCNKGVVVYLFNVQGIVSADIGEIQATNCDAPFIGTNFIANKGAVKVAGLTVNGCTENPVRLPWSSNGPSLQFGNIHAINACVGGLGGVRYASIVSVDIDSAVQPAGELGNFTVGDIYITNTGANSVVTPFYFKDNTVAANRTLGNARIGKIYGTAALDYFYADGPVAANFLFTQKSVSSYYLNPRRPALYSEIDIIAGGFDFEFRIGADYKTAIKLNKIDLTSAPIKVYPPVGGQFYPLSKAVGGYLQTQAPGSSLDMRFLSGVNYIQDVVTGTWTAP